MSELPPNQPPSGPPHGPSDGPPTLPEYPLSDGPPTVPDYQPTDGPPTVRDHQPDPTFVYEPGFGQVPDPQPPSWGPSTPQPAGSGPPPWSPEMQPVPTDGRGGKPLPLIIGGLVLLVATAVGGAFLLTRDDDNGTENTSSNGDPNETVDSRPPDESEDPDDPGTDDPDELGTDDTTTTTEPETTTTTEPETTTTGPDITTTAGSPDEAISAFFDAYQAGDCYTAVEFASESVIENEGGEQAMIEDCEESLLAGGGVGTFTLEDATVVEQSGDTATVEITITVEFAIDDESESTTESDTVDMVFENGGWKFNEW